METFAKLFGSRLLFVYHCSDRVVINGYLNGSSRPGQVAHFFHDAVGEPAIGKEALSRRTLGTRAGWRRFPATTASPSNGPCPRTQRGSIGVLLEAPADRDFLAIEAGRNIASGASVLTLLAIEITERSRAQSA